MYASIGSPEFTVASHKGFFANYSTDTRAMVSGIVKIFVGGIASGNPFILKRVNCEFFAGKKKV